MSYPLPDPDAVRVALESVIASDPRLLALVRPYEHLLTGRAFRRLRRAVRPKDAEEDEEPAVSEEEARLFLTLSPALAGGRLLVVGGYEREEVREELEEGLQLDRVRWIECEHSHMPDWSALGASIRSGGVSMVVVLNGFVGHSAEELKISADAAGVPYVRVGSGCGLLAILRAMQRTVDPAERGVGTVGGTVEGADSRG